MGTTEFGTGFTLVHKVTFGHVAGTPDPISSGSEQLFLKLSSPTHSTQFNMAQISSEYRNISSSYQGYYVL